MSKRIIDTHDEFWVIFRKHVTPRNLSNAVNILIYRYLRQIKQVEPTPYFDNQDKMLEENLYYLRAKSIGYNLRKESLGQSAKNKKED